MGVNEASMATSYKVAGNRSLGFVDADNLHRAKSRGVPGTRFEIRRWPPLSYLPLKPEFFDDLAERILRILLEKTRAGIPAGTTADAG